MPNSFTRAALLRWRFVRSLCHYVRVVWPVLSALLLTQWLLGMIVGHVEGWSIGDASYFTFVTGLTVGYGDLVPRQAVSRVLAVLIGLHRRHGHGTVRRSGRARLAGSGRRRSEPTADPAVTASPRLGAEAQGEIQCSDRSNLVEPCFNRISNSRRKRILHLSLLEVCGQPQEGVRSAISANWAAPLLFPDASSE